VQNRTISRPAQTDPRSIPHPNIDSLTPAQEAANGANTTAVFAGIDSRSGDGYVYLETFGDSMGTRPMKNGKDGVQVHITNTSNLPVDAIETEYPLLVEEYSLVPDSGGAGRYRNGRNCGV